MEDPATGSWHLDKRVPVALIFTIAIQTGAIIWWAAGINARVEHLERQFMVTAPYGERIIRLEENVISIREGISDIKGLLRRPDPGR
jgi:hypothetical protein